MPEDISIQILTQASENIQKLFDLSTRIDERVKMIQLRQEQMDKRIDESIIHVNATMQKIAVLEFREKSAENTVKNVEVLEQAAVNMDKRLDVVEGKNQANNDRWNRFATFIIQLVWVILAAYLLTKLHLQAPAIP